MVLHRRNVLKGLAGVGLAAVKAPYVQAQGAPIKIGLLTVKTGPLAQGGIQMEQGIVVFLKERNYSLAGRKVEFLSADTGGNPAGAKTKAQELVERDYILSMPDSTFPGEQEFVFKHNLEREQLEREIGSVCRKVARMVAEGTAPRRMTASEPRVRELLGKRRFFSEARRRTSRAGVATGLAWTPVGGDVPPGSAVSSS